MNRHHPGSGRRTVIPPDWAAAHAPVAEGTMLGVVAFSTTSTATWNETLKRSVASLVDPFATGIPARIQSEVGRGAAIRTMVDAVDDQVRVNGYLIAVPRTFAGDAQLAVGVLVAVTGTDDTLLTGRTLRVNDIIRGTHRFERDLLCDLND